MAFTVSDYHDLVRLLSEHPEWQAELRRLLLADDFLELPRIVRELAEAQKRTEARVEELAEAQKRTEARLERLEATVLELAEAQKRTEARLESLEEVVRELAEAQKRTEGELQKLTESQRRITNDLAKLKGWHLEWRYERHPHSFFGSRLRRARTVTLGDLLLAEEGLDKGQLTDAEWEELTALDLFIWGRRGKGAEAPEILVAMEISWVIDNEDVERAHKRASLLRRVGYPAVGAVGGEGSLAEAEEYAREKGVIVALEGRIEFFDEAIAGLLASGDGGGPAGE